MANLDNVVPALRAAGLVVHETPGWSTRGYAGQDLIQILGVLWHHTATNRLQFARDAAPTLGLLVNGRSDLAGPLCNIGLDRNGEVWMVATGVANHAGAGSAPGVPTDMGNHYLIGIEMESSGIAPWDWTPKQLAAAPKLGAALEKLYLQKLPVAQRLQIGHMEYSSQGKIDPAGWPGGMDGLRRSINSILAAKPPVAIKPAPAPKPPVKAPTTTNYVPDPHWRVDPGETLGGIAAHWGVSVDALAKWNGIKNPNAVKVGERIWRPQDGYGTWTVDPGDTLAEIVAWTQRNWNSKITLKSICFANGINNPNSLAVGLRLKIA